MAAERARRFAMLTSEATSPEAIDQLREDVQRLALACPQRPLAELLGDLVETQDTLFVLLERRQEPQQSRQLRRERPGEFLEVHGPDVNCSAVPPRADDGSGAVRLTGPLGHPANRTTSGAVASSVLAGSAAGAFTG